MQWLVEYGRRRGIRVGLEAGVFLGLIVWNTATVLELIDRVGYNDFYVNFDPSHYQSAGDNVVQTFQKLRERIIHVHAKDGRGTRQAFEFPLDVDSSVKPLYGHQQGAERGYNRRKPGRPWHVYHTYFVAHRRLVLAGEVQPGNHTASSYAPPGWG